MKSRASKTLKESPLSTLNWILRIPRTSTLLPSYIQLESTTKCNMNCKPCLRSKSENFDMNYGLYTSIINQLRRSRFGTQQVDLTGMGEPLLNPSIVSMIEYAKAKGFKVGFTSNFTLMDERTATKLLHTKLDYLYISFDGAKKTTFERIRVGAKYEDTISRIKMFVKLKKDQALRTPLLKMNVTLTKDNLEEIPELIKLAQDLELNSINFNRQITPKEKHWKRELSATTAWEKRAQTKIKVGRRGIPLKRPQPCIALKGCYITYDGKVLPCNSLIQILCRTEYDNLRLGELTKSSLHEIWFSKSYKKFRTQLASGKRPDFCRYCPRPYQM